MRQTVNSVVGKCMIYKRWQSIEIPTMAPSYLQSYRVNGVEFFVVTGLDYIGVVAIRSSVGVHTTLYIVYLLML